MVWIQNEVSSELFREERLDKLMNSNRIKMAFPLKAVSTSEQQVFSVREEQQVVQVNE